MTHLCIIFFKLSFRITYRINFSCLILCSSILSAAIFLRMYIFIRCIPNMCPQERHFTARRFLVICEYFLHCFQRNILHIVFSFRRHRSLFQCPFRFFFCYHTLKIVTFESFLYSHFLALILCFFLTNGNFMSS